eukprot:TRINITY_DN5897_c0_g2_i1.p1 TRINITY_DN5897_c0_g2~~TRINITY_DN5897_c0_g2_i1.p1  ORF type:complete len:603 (-),score=176.55 TRINITY_DN5897_c0_g2_i1:140-1948(-)
MNKDQIAAMMAKLSKPAGDFVPKPKEKIVEKEETPRLTGFGAIKPAADAESTFLSAMLGAQKKSMKRKVSANYVPGKANDSNSETSKKTDEDPEKLIQLTDLIEQRKLPISNEISLRSHRRMVSSVKFDRKGARPLTGGVDNEIHLSDFAGMNRKMEPFRQFEPDEGYPIAAVSWSDTGSNFVVATSGPTPKIYDRDGNHVITFIRGDPCLQDMRKIRGHKANVTDAKYHPLTSELVLTSSIDTTLRVWDINGRVSFDELINRDVIKCVGIGVAASACAWGPDGSKILGAHIDGSLRLTDVRSIKGRARIKKITGAHKANSDSPITAVEFIDNEQFLSRGGVDDGTIKLWDSRNLYDPVKTFSIPSMYEVPNFAISPDGRTLCAGQCYDPKINPSMNGKLVFFDLETSSEEPLCSFDAFDSSCMSIDWSRETNQIMIGSSDGEVKVLFDPDHSKKGALLCAGRAPKKTSIDDLQAGAMPIITPHALPMFREEVHHGRARAMTRKDPMKSHRPGHGLVGPGHFGAVKPNITQVLAPEVAIIRDNAPDIDPREALLKYAKIAEEKPMFGRSYKYTQPKNILASKTLEEEQAEYQKKVFEGKSIK